MSRAVMQQALEALENPDGIDEYNRSISDSAITALRAALAEPEQPYDQTALDLCKVCGWRTLIPGDACLNCERSKPPEQEPVAIKWTLNGDKHCGYSNWVGETPFGRILITWKSWKDLSDACVDEFPGGFWAYGEPDEVKAQCEAEFCRRLGTAPTPQPEQEPCAMRYDFDGYGYKYIDSGSGSNWQTRIKGAEPLFTAPPQREHITDGSPCWCNPDVIEEEGGNVIVHNYDDHWQQYAKPGETAQQCIERHRGEQDALMKLYATPRKPLTEEEIVRLMVGEDRVQLLYAKPDDPYFSEFAQDAIRELVESGRAIERAHGITGESK